MGERRQYGLVILAAGASRRMGTPKALLPVDGRPMVVRVVEAALAAPVWPVVVVLGAHAAQVRPVLARYPVLVVENAAWPEGMASSLRTGLALLLQFSRQLDGALLALCDQPAFSATTVTRLIAAREATGRSIAASRYSARRGAPALVGREHFAALAALTGEEGARLLLNGDPAQVAEVDLPELAVDLDTPEDYERWIKAAGC
jgi:CTP:molybdopterin cytidylyltransferase MocA